MAATKYQILYRYTNPNSNQFIKNDSNTEYKPIFELYNDKHKIAIGTADEKLAASNEKSQLIIDGNNTASDNYNMLFKFTGTKRKNKKVWMPASTGYVIRDKQAIKNLVTRAVDGDYSGQYLLIEGSTIENGVVVSKTNPLKSNFYIKDNSLAANKAFYESVDELNSIIVNMTIAKLTSENVSTYGKLNTFPGGVCDIAIKVGYEFETKSLTYLDTHGVPTPVSKALTSFEYGTVQTNGGLGFSSITVTPGQVETYEIPAHYEEVADYPYAVCDTYARIEQSPWFILSSCASLPAVLEKAKMIVKAVGLENVKLIKTVPTEQFIKIK